MTDKRVLIVGDLAAMLLFALIGIASHERDMSVAILARSFVPFAVAWLTLGAALGAFRHERPSGRLLAVYVVCGITALVARSLVFDRSLLNAFFVIALVGNGLLLFAWRWARAGFAPRSEASRGARRAEAPRSVSPGVARGIPGSHAGCVSGTRRTVDRP